MSSRRSASSRARATRREFLAASAAVGLGTFAAQRGAWEEEALEVCRTFTWALKAGSGEHERRQNLAASNVAHAYKHVQEEQETNTSDAERELQPQRRGRHKRAPGAPANGGDESEDDRQRIVCYGY